MFAALLDKLFNRPLTEDQFARLVTERARSAGYAGELEYQASEFRLRQAHGAYFNLHNAFRDYQNADKAQKATVLNGYVTTLMESGQRSGHAFEQVKAQLRPVIRNRAMLEEIRLEHLRSEPNAPFETVFRPLGEDCVILLAVDSPESTSTLTQGPEAQWGVTLDEALAIAIDNLRDTTHEALTEMVPGLYVGEWADGYDSSRVLLPDVLQRAPVKGRPVFMIPNRDVLLVTGDKDEHGIAHMIEVAIKALENGRAVSTGLYTYAGQDIVAFAPEEPATRQRLATLEHLLLQGNYHQQKALLDTLNQETNNDVFVASYQLFELPDEGKTVSLCSWTEGVLTLLPRTDRVALVELVTEGEHNVKVVEWHEVQALLSEWLVLEEGYPTRYRTLGFPTAEQLARLTPV